MKSLFSLLTAMFIGFISTAQVTVQTNIPASIAPNSNLTIEVKISKGNITNFSKYQMDVPAGVTVTEGESKTGNFTFESNRAKIVWVSIPTEPEFIISFKMAMGSMTGPGVFNHKFYYLDNGSKQEVELEPVNVTFDAAGATVATSLGAGSGTTPSTSQTVATAVNTNTQSNVPVTPTPVETPKTAPKEEPKTSPIETAKTTPKEEPKITPKEEPKTTTQPVTETKTTKEPEKTTAPAVDNTASKTTASSGTVYKVQIGAYGYDPGKSRFANAGKVTISNEGGFYKVLVGSFSSKQEAIGKLNELKGSGFNGFVVTYQNGVRVK